MARQGEGRGATRRIGGSEGGDGPAADETCTLALAPQMPRVRRGGSGRSLDAKIRTLINADPH